MFHFGIVLLLDFFIIWNGNIRIELLRRQRGPSRLFFLDHVRFRSRRPKLQNLWLLSLRHHFGATWSSCLELGCLFDKAERRMFWTWAWYSNWRFRGLQRAHLLFQQLLHDLVHFDLEFKLGLFEGFVFLDYVCVTEELGIAVVFDHVVMFDPLDALLFQPRVFCESSLPFFSTYVAAIRILLILFQSYNFQAILAILINDEIHQVFGLNFLLVQLQSI